MSLSQVLEWKYGPVAGTRQADPEDKSPNPKMKITSWNHPTVKKPSASQLEKDFVEYEAYLETIAYKDLRAKEYPSIVDQLDAIWKGGTDFDAMKSKIEAVKTKHPKG